MEYNDLIYNTVNYPAIGLQVKLLRKEVITIEDIAIVKLISESDSEHDYVIAGKNIENKNIFLILTEGRINHVILGIPDLNEEQLKVYFKKSLVIGKMYFKNSYYYNEFCEQCSKIKLDSTKKINNFHSNNFNKQKFKKLNFATKVLFAIINFEYINY